MQIAINNLREKNLLSISLAVDEWQEFRGYICLCWWWWALIRCVQNESSVDDIVNICISFTSVLCNSSGIAAYIKAVRPEIKVIGVEADDAAGKDSTQSVSARSLLSYV